jgi:hypothetical protein
MTKPGLSRAVPLAIIAFMLSALGVFIVRWLQSMEPLYDGRVTLVVAPFVMCFAFIWGMGGFDPRMSEHAHPPVDEEGKDAAIVPAEAIKKDTADTGHAAHGHHEPEPTWFSILTSQLWTVTALTLLLVGAFFVLALLPTGLRLDTTADPAASPSIFATNMEFLTPLGIPINNTNMIQADKLTVFAGFIIFTILSLLVFAGGIGFLFHYLNKGVVEVRATLPTPEQLTPPAPVRAIGRISGRLARALRRGIPSFFQR